MKQGVFVAVSVIVMWGCGGGDPMPDAAVGDDAAAGLDCAAVIDCANACPDAACADTCVARASPEGLAATTDLVRCVEREACGEDEVCIRARCGAELVACFGPVFPDAGAPRDGGGVIVRDAAARDAGDAGDALPARIEGTTTDRSVLSGTLVLLSTGTVTFVRDDAAGAGAGFPADRFAFYRLDQIEYRARMDGLAADTCTYSADFTHSFSATDPAENYLFIDRSAGADGLREYALSTAFAEPHPNGLVVTCPPPLPSSTANFSAEHYVSSGTPPGPRTDGRTFTGEFVTGPRTRQWDLRAVD